MTAITVVTTTSVIFIVTLAAVPMVWAGLVASVRTSFDAVHCFVNVGLLDSCHGLEIYLVFNHVFNGLKTYRIEFVGVTS